MFVFISAMFGLVFSNNIIWVFFFWEITTLCSFLLIGYTKTEEATKNAFTALWMNLLGGIAFAAAILYLATLGGGMHGPRPAPCLREGHRPHTRSAHRVCRPDEGRPDAVLLMACRRDGGTDPGLRPAPLQHDGEGRCLYHRPARTGLPGNVSGYTLALVGAITFLLASGIAVSQSNAKRVLAYSTIANLGLVVACAGIGTYEAIWAAILLIIFHAISKSLLFLAVGTVEHHISSRDIEDMNGLIDRMPKVAAMMVIGIAGMFLAPFGMLISKWVAIRAFIDAPFGFVFVIILAFGSAITVFFWAKWMGKIISCHAGLRRISKGKSTKANGRRSSRWRVLPSLPVSSSR